MGIALEHDKKIDALIWRVDELENKVKIIVVPSKNVINRKYSNTSKVMFCNFKVFTIIICGIE